MPTLYGNVNKKIIGKKGRWGPFYYSAGYFAGAGSGSGDVVGGWGSGSAGGGVAVTALAGVAINAIPMAAPMLASVMPTAAVVGFSLIFRAMAWARVSRLLKILNIMSPFCYYSYSIIINRF